MLTLKDIKPSKHLSVYIAVAFAEEVLHLFEERYPKDLRPREAIEAAKRYLDNPSAAKAYAAASSAAYAASAASSAASATNAAYAAYYAANVVASATYYADAATYAASADAAASASAANEEEYIHERIKKLLPYILQYKIDNKEPFGNPEKVLEHLSEKEQEVALFHLDILV